MVRTLKRRAWLMCLVLLAATNCRRYSATWDKSGCLVCSRSDSVVRIDLASAQIDTLVSIGDYGGPNAPASLMGRGRWVVFSENPIQGDRAVVVYDFHSKTEIGRYAGTQAVAADDDHTIVFWRILGPGNAALVWQDVRGESGVIGEIEVESIALLDAPVRIGQSEVAFTLGERLAVFDARTKAVKESGLTGLTPLCDAGAGRLLCRRGESREVVLVDRAKDTIEKSYGAIHSVGWARDPINGGVLCAVPSDAWWSAEEVDLASLDLESGRVVHGVRGFVMVGGVVTDCGAGERERR